MYSLRKLALSKIPKHWIWYFCHFVSFTNTNTISLTSYVTPYVSHCEIFCMVLTYLQTDSIVYAMPILFKFGQIKYPLFVLGHWESLFIICSLSVRNYSEYILNPCRRGILFCPFTSMMPCDRMSHDGWVIHGKLLSILFRKSWICSSAFTIKERHPSGLFLFWIISL